MANRKLYLHYLGLVGAIALGAILRFWHLDLKPLWMDEVITAIFSFGKSYNNVPLDVLLPLERVPEIFTIQPGVSCSQIAKNLATQSTHPPLFFCWMYSWLELLSPVGSEWIAKLRFPAAFFGVGAIVAIYSLNRIAFFRSAGIIGAAFMAVSPLAVYLSQEARHYTLPMLLITLALLGLVQIVKDIERQQKVRFWVWLQWAIMNSIGLYVHYFCTLAFIAQIATLLVLICWYRANIMNKRQIWLALILSTSVVAISFLPWLPMVVNDYNRAEIDWLQSPKNISPFYQTLISWLLMVISLPVENQPFAIAFLLGLSMLLFGIWVGWQVFQGLKQLLYEQSTHLATFTLLSFSVWVLLEFFAIAYLLGKDITAVPRYHFVYYPAFCALLSASFAQVNKKEKIRKKCIFNVHSSIFILLIVGILSCVFVVSDLVFQKPFEPGKVAQNMNQDPSIPLMMVVGYRDYQDVALGLSFALALEPLRGVGEDKLISSSPSSNVAFFKQSPDFASVLQKLSQLPTPTATHLNLWVVGPGRKRRDYPQQIAVSQQMTCSKDSLQYYRIGVPYQLYHCKN
ncbi:glycosyltransferase family 39 protein [Mastigocladopsis repens]|uniref:glycosyltransferase family 39 protein n=1 Tax=Mastigocladopsis repens TaxID=221287 RepID=UPI0002E0680C|nr:glycosyltransferase family 39 protein [Mastigocladopsis repens]